MARRVLESNAAIRVSKTGTDVVTATNPNDLLFDSDYVGFGSFISGQVNVSAGVNKGGWRETEVSFSNPLSYVPLVMIQQTVDASTSKGFRYHEDITEIIQPGGDPIVGDSDSRTFDILLHETHMSKFRLLTSATGLVRYHIFYLNASNDVFSAGSVALSGLNWTSSATPSSSVATNDQTISGLTTGVEATLKFMSSVTVGSSSAYILRVRRTRGGTTVNYDFASGSTMVFVDVQNSDVISMALIILDATERNITITISNYSDGDTVIDTVGLHALFIDDTPASLNWTNVSGQSPQTSNSQTVTGINVPITLAVNFSPAYTGQFAVNGSYASYTAATSITFTANNNTAYTFGFQPTSDYSGTVTIVNQTDGNTTLDTFTVAVTVFVPDYIPDAINWANISGSTSASASHSVIGSNQTLGGINSAITINARVTPSSRNHQKYDQYGALVSGTGNFAIYAYENNTSVGSVTWTQAEGNTQKTITWSSVNADQIKFGTGVDVSDDGYGGSANAVALVSVQNGSNSDTELDTLTATISASYRPDVTPDNYNWNNINITGGTGGTAGNSNTITVSGLAIPVVLLFATTAGTSSFNGFGDVSVYKNGSLVGPIMTFDGGSYTPTDLAVSISNGDTIYLRLVTSGDGGFGAEETVTATIEIRNQTDNNVLYDTVFVSATWS